MRHPPDDLDPADLATVLAVEWGLHHVTLTYAPVGFGGHHWVADVNGTPAWFVTAARPAPGLAAAFATAVALRDAGLEFVVAPVTTELGGTTVTFGGHAVSLTPWHAGATEHAGSGADVVDLAVALHGATHVARGIAAIDDLVLEGRAGLESALAVIDRRWSDGPYAADLREVLAPVADRLRARLATYDTAAAALDRTGYVVTHGELKPGNLLATPAGTALVDWDTARLAPPERDLWRLPTADRAAWSERTGRLVDPAAVEFYRTRWDLTDVALYVDDLRHAPARTADTETAWTMVRRLLA